MVRASTTMAMLLGATVLAGCGSLGSSPAGPNPVLSAYTPTLHSGGATIEGALAGGVEGFGTGTGLPVAAAGAPAFTTGKVTLAGGATGTASVEVGGATYSLLNYVAPAPLLVGRDYLENYLKDPLHDATHDVWTSLTAMASNPANGGIAAQLNAAAAAIIASRSEIHNNYSAANTVIELQKIKSTISGVTLPPGEEFSEFVAFIDILIHRFSEMQSHVANLPSYSSDLYVQDSGDNALILFGSDNVKVAALLHDPTIAGGSLADFDGYKVLITGLQTPEGNLPTALANYKGIWYAASGSDFEQGGGFSLGANFNAKTVSGSIWNWDETASSPSTSMSGGIYGSQFSGTTTALKQSTGLTGEVVGAFYGPAAEEVAGTAAGTVQGAPVTAVFIGSQ